MFSCLAGVTCVWVCMWFWYFVCFCWRLLNVVCLDGLLWFGVWWLLFVLLFVVFVLVGLLVVFMLFSCCLSVCWCVGGFVCCFFVVNVIGLRCLGVLGLFGLVLAFVVDFAVYCCGNFCLFGYLWVCLIMCVAVGLSVSLVDWFVVCLLFVAVIRIICLTWLGAWVDFCVWWILFTVCGIAALVVCFILMFWLFDTCLMCVNSLLRFVTMYSLGLFLLILFLWLCLLFIVICCLDLSCFGLCCLRLDGFGRKVLLLLTLICGVILFVLMIVFGLHRLVFAFVVVVVLVCFR